MGPNDLPAVLDAQEAGGVLGLAEVFPQDRYPFPRVAQAAHDAVLARMLAAGTERAWLAVFTANARGRRFYERLGWRPTDVTTRSTYPPHAELRRYERDLL